MIARLHVQERGWTANLETPGGVALQAQLGAQGGMIPFFAFLDARGKLIANSDRPVPGKPGGVDIGHIGHPIDPAEIDYFMWMLRKAVPTLARADVQVIEDYLRNQMRQN